MDPSLLRPINPLTRPSARRAVSASATFEMGAPIGMPPSRHGLSPINIPRPSSSYDDRMFSLTDRDLLSSSLDISGPLSPLFAPASYPFAPPTTTTTHTSPLSALSSGMAASAFPSSCMSRTLSTRSSSSASSCGSSTRSVRFSEDKPRVKHTWPKGIYDRAPIQVDASSKGLGMKRCKTSRDARNEDEDDDEELNDDLHFREVMQATAAASRPILSPPLPSSILTQRRHQSSINTSPPTVPVMSAEARRTLTWLATSDHDDDSSDDDTDDGDAHFGFRAGTLYSEVPEGPVRATLSRTTSRPDLRELSETSLPSLGLDDSALAGYNRNRLLSDASTIDNLTFNDRSISPVSMSPDISPNNSSLFDDAGLNMRSSPSKRDFETTDIAVGPRMMAWEDSSDFGTARKLRTTPLRMPTYPSTISNPIFIPAKSESLLSQQQYHPSPQMSAASLERRTALRAKFSLRANNNDHDCLGGF